MEDFDNNKELYKILEKCNILQDNISSKYGYYVECDKFGLL